MLKVVSCSPSSSTSFLRSAQLNCTMVCPNYLKTLLLAVVTCSTAAFVSPVAYIAKSQTATFAVTDSSHECGFTEMSQPISQRRFLLQNLSAIMVASTGMAVSSIPGVANADAETMERGGVQLTPFNSLAFNYRGT